MPAQEEQPKLTVLRKEHGILRKVELTETSTFRVADIILIQDNIILVAAKNLGLVSLVREVDKDSDVLLNEVYSNRSIGINERGEPIPCSPQEYFRANYTPEEKKDRPSYELLRSKLALARRTVEAFETQNV